MTVFIIFGVKVWQSFQDVRSQPEQRAELATTEFQVSYFQALRTASLFRLNSIDAEPLRDQIDHLISHYWSLRKDPALATVSADGQQNRIFTMLEFKLEDLGNLVDQSVNHQAKKPALFEQKLLELEPQVSELVEFGKVSSAQNRTELEAYANRVLIQSLLAFGGFFGIFCLSLVGLHRQSAVASQRANEISSSNHRMAATINASLDAILVTDSAGTILDFNSAAQTLFGNRLAVDGVNSITALELRPEDADNSKISPQDLIKCFDDRFLKKGRMTLSAKSAAGTRFPIEVSLGFNREKKRSVYIAFIRDISDRVAAQFALTEARDRALRADQAKSDFIAVMSHEMRTPLNGLLGTLDLLRQTPLNSKQQKHVDIMESSGDILLRHMSDVLDISSVEVGKMRPESVRFDCADLLAEVVELNEPTCRSAGIDIHARLKGVKCPRLIGDRHRIRQLLMNLVGNALKYTPSGSIEILCHQSARSNQKILTRFAVSDSGIGIASEDQERIFEAFTTAESTYERHNSGVGLGLAICRRIVEAMDGSMGVESSVGSGSTFWFELELGIHSSDEDFPKNITSTKAIRNRPINRPLRILLVEDNEINRYVGREMLQSHGHEITEASDGRIGVENAHRTVFDLILMDISMPGMNGIDATIQIRTGQGASCNTPIIGLTAHALPSEQERFLKAGMQECLIKPLKAQSLQEVLLKYGNSSETGQVAPNDPAVKFDSFILDEQALAELSEMMDEPEFGDLITRALDEIDVGISSALNVRDDFHYCDRKSLIHKLSGTAATIGAQRLFLLLNEIEEKCGADDRAIIAYEDAIQTTLKDTKDELSVYVDLPPLH